jgi:hypothetical protein
MDLLVRLLKHPGACRHRVMVVLDMPDEGSRWSQNGQDALGTGHHCPSRAELAIAASRRKTTIPHAVVPAGTGLPEFESHPQ